VIDFETPNIDFSNRDRALQQIWSFVQSFQEQVSFWMRNLDKDNFNETGLKEIIAPISAEIADMAGNVTEMQITAEGVKMEVDGLKDRNTVTIDSTGLYVTDAQGNSTKLAGDQITSGTITGVTLISSGTGAKITISDGSISFSGGGGSAKLTQTSRTGLYIEAGSVSGQGISISTDSFDVSANGGISLSSPVYISDDLTVAQNINSSGTMKLNAGGNASFDAGGTLYLQTNGGDINIGNGGNIRLNGTVTVNGSPLATG